MDIMRCDFCGKEIEDYNFVEIVTFDDIYDFHLECESAGREQFNIEIRQ